MHADAYLHDTPDHAPKPTSETSPTITSARLSYGVQVERFREIAEEADKQLADGLRVAAPRCHQGLDRRQVLQEVAITAFQNFRVLRRRGGGGVTGACRGTTGACRGDGSVEGGDKGDSLTLTLTVHTMTRKRHSCDKACELQTRWSLEPTAAKVQFAHSLVSPENPLETCSYLS